MIDAHRLGMTTALVLDFVGARVATCVIKRIKKHDACGGHANWT
jgi:hypothetical protein